jgi:hypothetical protein
LIRRNVDVFALDGSELGYTEVVQHHVNTGDHTPVKQQFRRIPSVHHDIIEKMVQDMTEQGVIRPSISPWASPVVLVPKKDGTKRFCVDYRRLNGITKKDVYPLPRIDDILDTVGGCQFFTSLDLASGYWQVGLDEESSPKSAFVTHCGLYEFTRMPFGMCNAPATFQRLMEVVLADLLWKECFAYIDDILVSTRDFRGHLKTLQEVFNRIRKAGLRLKAKKCQFLKTSVSYLGHLVTREGIQPDPAKTDKVVNYPLPTNVNEVRSFLGLASYYRRFVPGFSQIATPLHCLLKKDAEFYWSVECQQAFEQLKSKLSTAPVLAYPRFNTEHPFILETDASGKGLGAVLAQQQDDGKVHPIAFASRALNNHERNYGITEMETLAVVWAAKLFRPYLLGHCCEVITDHAACVSLLNTAHPSPKLARWAMCIQELNLKINHRPGKSNLVADALSRNPVPLTSVLQIGTVDDNHDPSTDVSKGTSDDLKPESDLVQLQRQDPELNAIFRYLEDGILPEDCREARCLALEKASYDIVDGVLCYTNPDLPDDLRIAVPLCLRSTLLRENHEGKFAGHFAERKLYSTLRTKYWWKGMRADVRAHCRSCLTCASRKGPGRGKRAALQPIPVGGPFHTVGVDVLQLPKSFDGNKYAIVFMDYFTKWPEVFAASSQTAETIARLFVEHVVTRHGVPERLLSDRGPNFLSHLVTEVCKLLGSSKVNTSGYHPQCDGLVEKFNGTLVTMLSKCVEKNGRDWDTHLPYLLFAYRVAVQESTQHSPFLLLYGRQPRIPSDTALNQPRTPYQIEFQDYAGELVAKLSEAWALAHQSIKQAQRRQKVQYDKRIKEPDYEVGQRVMVHHPSHIRGEAWKLARPYFGPYEVIALTPTNAEVKPLNHPNGKSIFVALDRLRHCYPEMTNDVWFGHGTPVRKNKSPR